MPNNSSEIHVSSPGLVPRRSSSESRNRGSFDILGFQPTADTGAMQVIDHEDGIFCHVKNNDEVAAFNIIDRHPDCLHDRDAVGGTPVHIAFLYRNHDLGKRILREHHQVGTLTFSLERKNMEGPRAIEASDRYRTSPYEGQNLLHIAIMHQEPELAKWLIQNYPILIHGETTGKFFAPQGACYFGSTPLLFALSTNQIDVALKILDRFASESFHYHQQKDTQEDPNNTIPGKSTSSKKPKKLYHSARCEEIHRLPAMSVTVLNMEDQVDLESRGVSSADDQLSTGYNAKRIFRRDRYKNNVLHLAVLHNLPNIYDFAINYAMEMFSMSEESALNVGENLISDPRKDGETNLKSDEEPQNKKTTPKNNNVVDFLKQADDFTYKQMMKFLLERNLDELTPLSLAAAIGCSEMFQHIINRSSINAWDYGPIRAYNIPLLDLEQPVPHATRPGRLYRLFRKLPYPIAPPRSERHYLTAIDCLCSFEVLSSSLSKKPEEMEKVYDKRLKMLGIYEVHRILHKKWKYVYKRRFLTYYALYCVYLVTLNVTLLVGGYGKQPRSFRGLITWSSIIWILSRLSDFLCVSLAITKLTDELQSLVFHFWVYISESGAAKWDNIVSIIATISALIGYFLGVFDIADTTRRAFTAIALIFGWLYHFFFFLGFKTTGPFIVMIMNMISSDLTRFFLVFIVVLAGFSQAHFVLLEEPDDILKITHSIGRLLISGIVGEIDYENNYGDKSFFVQAVMWAFIVLVLVLLLNLLIAMMGNTYARILQESEGRWIAERYNIMASFESQLSDERAISSRNRYGFPFRSRLGKQDMYVQLQIRENDVWRVKILAEESRK